ncbi:MAG: transglutaminase-like putative cysteine protease [Bradymonadia bacterium]|jgi:transglutaminase-like putative cysteine protease
MVGCKTAMNLISIPIAAAVLAMAAVVALVVRADGLSEEAELRLAGLRVDRHAAEITVAADSTFEGRLIVETTVVSAAGLKHAQETSFPFDPDTQELELVAASVLEPDGTVVEVGPAQVFERPSAPSQDAPGFVSTMTKSVLFPQLSVGSQTRAEWRFKQLAPSALGFSYTWRPLFTVPVKEATIRVTYDDQLPMRYDAQEPFVVTTGEDDGVPFILATLTAYAGQAVERAMLSPRDLCPKFVVSTLDSWEIIGAKFNEAVISRVEVTPEIDALAAEIVGGREGVEAARAIHRWVCKDVQYVVVELNHTGGWVPRPVNELLETRYGDCKDKYVLSASLLAARGIRSEPVLVKYDRGFEPSALPTPHQFDHCMAYLPDFDLYSNPTDTYRDLGDLDSSLSGKFVVIAAGGGRVAETPKGSPDVNRYAVSHTVSIGETGIVSGSSVMDFAGRTSGMVRRTLAATDDATKSAEGFLHAGSLGGHGELNSTEPSDLDMPLHCEGVWVSDIPLSVGRQVHFKTPTGIDIVNPLVLREFLTTQERLQPMWAAAITVSWHFEIDLPDGYTAEAPPIARSKQNGAGRYESRYELSPTGSIVVDRMLRIEQDRYTAEEYPELREILLECAIDIESILTARREG